MQDLPDYDADFTARAKRYRDRAQLLRLEAEALSGAARDELLTAAQELEQLADIIEGLRFRNG